MANDDNALQTPAIPQPSRDYDANVDDDGPSDPAEDKRGGAMMPMPS